MRRIMQASKSGRVPRVGRSYPRRAFENNQSTGFVRAHHPPAAARADSARAHPGRRRPMSVLAASALSLDASALDYAILAVYFVVVLGIGAVARLSIKTDVDFFLSGRSLPAWVTGLAFVAANLGALEILGMAANGAQYGVATVHFYWIGAVPAMIFLGIVMMPFYYGSRVRSVPEFLRRRFNNGT